MFCDRYRLETRFCNPYSGNEKGSVENAVGFPRRSLMVPKPNAESHRRLTRHLLSRCDAIADADHYRSGRPIRELFDEERGEMQPLPRARFDAVEWVERKADKEGNIQIGSVRYLAGPSWRGWTLLAGLRAFEVEIRTADGATRFAGVLIGSVVLSAGFMAGCSLFEAVTERYSRKFGFEYGQSRAWGSFGYAIVALCAGFLFNINPLLNFWVGSICGLGMLCVYAFWVPAEQKEELKKEADPNTAPTNPSFKEMLSVLKMPTLWVLIVFMLLTNTFYTVFDQQMFPNYYASLFSTTEIGNATYGTLNSFQVFLESAMMGVVPIIMKKIGVRNSLLLGATVMFLRIGLCGVFHDPVSVSIVKLFHSIEVPLFCLPAFRYFTLHFDTKLSATLYMVGFQIASQVGQVIFSTPLGALHDAMGDRPTFFTISAIVFAALVYGIFVIKKDDQEVGGDPFYTDKQLKAMEAAKA